MLASVSGLVLARFIPWGESARATGLDAATGIALGPFVAGMASVLVLGLLPGRSHSLHLIVVAALLVPGFLAGLRPVVLRTLWSLKAATRRPPVVRVALLVACLLLVALCVALPLTQNDALEYAIVGRLLYESRSLDTYPVIDGAATASGFFGPWTHPPLYVSLIYLADVIEGDAHATTLLRFIAPWCLLAAAACVGCLGRRISALAGALAAAIFIATPLLYLGASSALIDPLAVLGFTLAFVACTSVRGSILARGAVCGIALGLSLWTHSQALLFPLLLLPLMLLGDRLRPAVTSAALAVVVAVVIGGAPYLRNIEIFGSAISDTPAVYAFAPLDWKHYFAAVRGLELPSDILQYGILKGFFAIESYSTTFWLALLALPVACAALKAHGRRLLKSDAPVVSDGNMLLAASLLAVVIYLVGVVLSVSAGLDVMVRNERYMLVLMPCVALLGAAALHEVLPRPGVRRVVAIALTAVVGAQLLAMISYRVAGLSLGTKTAISLQAWPPYAAVGYLRERTPPEAHVLALKPADLFYADRTMVSYLDPRLIPFYDLSDPGAGVIALRQLGITHVYVPDYFLPPLYNSTLMAILADHRFSTLEEESNGYQVYRLAEGATAPPSCDQGVSAREWTRAKQLVFGGQRNMVRIPLGSSPIDPHGVSHSWNPTPVMQRQTTTVLVSDWMQLPASSADPFLVDADLKGVGYVLAYLRTADADGKPLEYRFLADLPLAGRRRIARRIRLPAEAVAARLEIEHRSVSHLHVESASIRRSCDAAPQGS